MIPVFAVFALAATAALVWPFWRARDIAAVVAIGVMLTGGSAALYLALGHPELLDAPYTERAKAPDFALRHEAWQLAKQLERNPAADGFSALGEMLIKLAGGRVTPEAGEAFAMALERNHADPRARFYAGLALQQRGRTQAALAVWKALDRDSKPNAAWLPLLHEKIREAEKEPRGFEEP
jgi:hypothetical protein